MGRPPKGKRRASADGSFSVAGKALNGEGSLYRESDGTWRATYRVPGVARLRRVRGRTREEALRGPPARRDHVGAPRARRWGFELVFTAATGGLMLRQKVAKVITAAAERAGIDPKGLSTHTGRSTVITTLYTEEGLDLGDLKRWVGHADEKTTAGYVRDLGERPKKTAEAAGRVLDPDPSSAP